MVEGRLRATVSDKSTDDLTAVIGSWERSLRGKKSPATIRAYTIAAKALRSFLLDRRMPTDPAAITREHVDEFLIDQGERNSASTARSRYAFLKVFFGWLLDEGEIRTNPMARIRPPKVEDRMPGDIDDAAFERIIATTAGKGFEQRRDKAILLLLADTGLRRAECASLKLSNIDLDADPPSVQVVGKGGKERRAYFRETTASVIDRYIQAERSKHRLASQPQLWLGRAGPLTGVGIGDVVKRRARQAGLDGIHAHLLRHRMAHRAKAANMSDESIMSILGHSNREVMARYGRAHTASRAAADYKRLLGDDADR